MEEKMLEIKMMDVESIHRICSSQVVVDLSTALKELVENSLDAGATMIEIKLKNMGADGIEVADNGAGIHPDDYESIVQKHHTSKIRQFEDLESVLSFGFRGEALNALCELSGKFQIITRRADDKFGSSLLFDKFGRLNSKSVCARAVGTTVIVENLFESLPVRRGEFVRNIKKHYQKALKVIQAYALFAVGVKISLSNTASNGRQLVLSVPATTKIEENISTLFGAKFLSSLLVFSCEVTDVDVNKFKEEIKLPDAEIIDDSTKSLLVESSNNQEVADRTTTVIPDQSENVFEVSVKGWISKVGVGVGRSDNDRQYIFCNKRPVDFPKMNKLFNEIWRKYEMKQKPAFIIDLQVSKGNLDVNVTPDKREIILKHELVVLEKIKMIVDELYIPSRNSFQINHLDITSFLSDKNRPSGSDIINSTQSSADVIETQDKVEVKPDLLINPTKSALVAGNDDKQDIITTFSEAKKIPSFLSSKPSQAEVRTDRVITWASTNESERMKLSTSSSSFKSTVMKQSSLSFRPLNPSHINKSALTKDCVPESSNLSGYLSYDSENKAFCAPALSLQSKTLSVSSPLPLEKACDPSTHNENSFSSRSSPPNRNPDHIEDLSSPTSVNPPSPRSLEMVPRSQERGRMWEVTTDSVLSSFQHCRKRSRPTNLSQQQQQQLHIDSLESAVSENIMKETHKTIKKEDFKRMSVLGQFNLGFIIAQLDQDLYILDQHACDEKYRFETLQRTTAMQIQPLLIPQTMDVSSANEQIITQNLSIFEENGFRLTYDSSNRIGNRLLLWTKPVYKDVEFNVNDINELASLLSDGHHEDITNSRISKDYLMVKNDEVQTKKKRKVILPKLMSTYASKACRTAVMIGMHLETRKMEEIVQKLAEIDQPWNCPHGRPTLRHLLDLKELGELL